MKFYDALQMDPAVLKREIAACDTKQEKAYYWIAMAVRSVLIVGFAIVFISLLSGVFGTDNTPMAVALFCMMQGDQKGWRKHRRGTGDQYQNRQYSRQGQERISDAVFKIHKTNAQHHAE